MNQSIFDNYPELKMIPSDRFPTHVFIIPDGNGRWAKQHNLLISIGHKRGFDVAEKITRDLSQIEQIKIVTMWGFSTDNWKRSAQEVKALMLIFEHVVGKVLKEFKHTNRRFIHLGKKDRIPKNLMKLIEKAENETVQNTGQIMCLALDFSGEDQNLRVLDLARHVSPNIPSTEALIWNLRDGHGLIPAADLLIRTSGEYRTSDVGWLNGVSTELYFNKKFFPDITIEDMIVALVDFSKRERRFGGREK